MSATTVYEGLAEAFSGIVGIKNIVRGEPTAIHEAPAIFTAYAGFTRPLRNSPPARNLEGTSHSFTSRLVILWTDPDGAEAQLLDLVTAIPDALDADPHLNGRLSKGAASCQAGTTGYLTIANTLYRIVDYTITVLEKREAT